MNLKSLASYKRICFEMAAIMVRILHMLKKIVMEVAHISDKAVTNLVININSV